MTTENAETPMIEYKFIPCSTEDINFFGEKGMEEYQADAPAADGADEKLVFKICNDGNLIGGCVLSIDTSNTAELERLWVDERYRRRGYGTALILRAELAAYMKSCRTIINSYCFDFQHARPLFEKLGYQLIGAVNDWPKGHEAYTLIKEFVCLASERVGALSALEITEGSAEDGAIIAARLEEFNAVFAPRSHPYLDLDKKLVDKNGNMISGCIAGVSGWDTLHIDELWVREDWRNRGIGSRLVSELKREAKAKGAYFSRLDAPDFQAGFFEKLGYSTMVIFNNNPKWLAMGKRL